MKTLITILILLLGSTPLFAQSFMDKAKALANQKKEENAAAAPAEPSKMDALKTKAEAAKTKIAEGAAKVQDAVKTEPKTEEPKAEAPKVETGKVGKTKKSIKKAPVKKKPAPKATPGAYQ